MGFEALTFGRLRGVGVLDRVLLILSISCSVIYIIALEWPDLPGRAVFKALSIMPIALLAFRLLRDPERQGKALLRDHDSTILGMALVLSSIGDVLLDLDPARLFFRGLLAFLTAHLIYILLFVRNWPRPLRPSVSQLILIAVILIYSLVLANWFAPSLGGEAQPVMLYVCAITVMVVTVILAEFSKPWTVLGGLLFMISDSLTAIDRYKMPLPIPDFLVWATYYLGQYGIAVGFLREKLGE